METMAMLNPYKETANTRRREEETRRDTSENGAPSMVAQLADQGAKARLLKKLRLPKR